MSKTFTVTSILLLILGIFLSYEYGAGRFSLAQAETHLELGRRIYLANCAACHGERGDGKGPEAYRLKTKPRDFTTGSYKFRSTPSGSLPLDEDILRSITRGVRTTSMLPQLHLSEQERWAVTDYLKTFSERFQKEKRPQAVNLPVRPDSSDELVAVGKELYEEAGCSQCHGPGGAGDGPSANDLKDELGRAIAPTNLTLKPFKSGPRPEDLYRTLSTGLNSTPMPSYADVLTPSSAGRWWTIFFR